MFTSLFTKSYGDFKLNSLAKRAVFLGPEQPQNSEATPANNEIQKEVDARELRHDPIAILKGAKQLNDNVNKFGEEISKIKQQAQKDGNVELANYCDDFTNKELQSLKDLTSSLPKRAPEDFLHFLLKALDQLRITTTNFGDRKTEKQEDFRDEVDNKIRESGLLKVNSQIQSIKNELDNSMTNTSEDPFKYKRMQKLVELAQKAQQLEDVDPTKYDIPGVRTVAKGTAYEKQVLLSDLNIAADKLQLPRNYLAKATFDEKDFKDITGVVISKPASQATLNKLAAAEKADGRNYL